jgi:hypothetical protein
VNALNVVYVVTMTVCLAVLIWHLVTRRRCEVRRGLCGCDRHGPHGRHHCPDCDRVWRTGEFGIEFGRNP